MKLYFFIASVFLLSSCVKDKPQEPIKTAVSINADTKVLIINEGNYGWGNASVSLFDPSSGSVIEDYYKQQNNNTALGDVCQSITNYNNNYYIVVNNSNKIVVAKNSDFSKQGTITGFTSARYLLPITYNKAYVTEYFANNIKIVDLNSNTITGTIPCNGWGDEMALIYNKAFITNLKSDYCYVINTVTDLITDSINVGQGASSVLIDKNSKVWVLSGGNSSISQTGKLTCINPVNLTIELCLNFNSNDSPGKLCSNKTRDTLYYLNKGVCQFPISSTSLPASPLIPQGTKVYYGLGINPKDHNIYVSDAIDYVQKSTVEIYQPNGAFKSNFKAGIITGAFAFE